MGSNPLQVRICLNVTDFLLLPDFLVDDFFLVEALGLLVEDCKGQRREKHRNRGADTKGTETASSRKHRMQQTPHYTQHITHQHL
jgi:hypothetical protein